MATCPTCHRPATRRDGFDRRGRQRFACHLCHRDIKARLTKELGDLPGGERVAQVPTDCGDDPSATWVVQQARQLVWRIADGELRPRFLLRDRDAKFTRAFDDIFRSEGVEVIRLPVRSPVANSFHGQYPPHFDQAAAAAEANRLGHRPIMTLLWWLRRSRQ